MLSLLCCPQTGRKFRPVIRFEGGNPAVNDIPLFGGIEAGGTKIVCALRKGAGDVQIELPRAGRDLWTGADVPAGPLAVPADGFRLVRLAPPR